MRIAVDVCVCGEREKAKKGRYRKTHKVRKRDSEWQGREEEGGRERERGRER